MTLTPCFQCKKSISKKAAQCPHCNSSMPHQYAIICCKDCGKKFNKNYKGECTNCGNPNIGKRELTEMLSSAAQKVKPLIKSLETTGGIVKGEMIEGKCKQCENPFKIRKEFSGIPVKCKSCEFEFDIPEPLQNQIKNKIKKQIFSFFFSVSFFIVGLIGILWWFVGTEKLVSTIDMLKFFHKMFG